MIARLLLLTSLTSCALAASDAPPGNENGKKLFAACAVCHDTGKTNKQGPGLGGIVGRRAGAAAGFRYSGAMRRSGLAWTPENLDAYLANPQQKVPGNIMPYAGVVDARDRADLIAYLKSL